MNMYERVAKLNEYGTCNPLNTELDAAVGTHDFGGVIPRASQRWNKTYLLYYLLSSGVLSALQAEPGFVSTCLILMSPVVQSGLSP